MKAVPATGPCPGRRLSGARTLKTGTIPILVLALNICLNTDIIILTKNAFQCPKAVCITYPNNVRLGFCMLGVQEPNRTFSNPQSLVTKVLSPYWATQLLTDGLTVFSAFFSDMPAGGATRMVATLFWVKKAMPSLPWTLLVPR